MSQLTIMSESSFLDLSNDQRHDAALTIASYFPADLDIVGTLLLMTGLARRSPAGLVAEGTDEFEMPWFTRTHVPGS